MSEMTFCTGFIDDSFGSIRVIDKQSSSATHIDHTHPLAPPEANHVDQRQLNRATREHGSKDFEEGTHGKVYFTDVWGKNAMSSI